MFRINYRITCTKENIKSMTAEDFHDVEGFFQIVLNKNKYGLYHDKPLREGEQGWWWIILWFEEFLETVLGLKTNNYILISDIESHNTWIEIKRVADMLSVNIVRAEKIDEDSNIVRRRKLNNIDEYLWHEDNTVSFKEFIDEITDKSNRVIYEIKSTNSGLMKSVKMINFIKLLETVRKD